jgi:uncharacterized repeat protein (TIGR01451 family)
MTLHLTQRKRKEREMATFYNQATLIHNGGATNSNVTEGEILELIGFNKTAISPRYEKGGTVSYLITIRNSGADLSNVTVTDNLGEYQIGGGSLFPLEYIDGSLLYFVNGTEATGATATVTDSRLVISGINVPAGGVAQLVYSARVTEFAPLSEGSAINNTATLCEAGLSELTSTAMVEAFGESALTIAKFVCPDVVTANGSLSYTFVIQNTGSLPAVATDNVAIVDTFTPELTISEVTLNGEALTEPDGYTYNPATGAFRTAEGVITVPAATYSQAEDGTVTMTPGVSVLTVSGTV